MKFLFSWFLAQLIGSILVAFWGFYMVFKHGIDSPGKVLLIIALIGLGTSTIYFFAYAWLKKRRTD